MKIKHNSLHEQVNSLDLYGESPLMTRQNKTAKFVCKAIVVSNFINFIKAIFA